jgi:hypothetical protein
MCLQTICLPYYFRAGEALQSCEGSKVTVDDFWKLIARVDRALLTKGDGYDDAAIRPLIEALAALEKNDLQSFQEHLAQVLYDLDGHEYFEASVNAAGSDDSFLYVRCFVVAMGQETYERTLRDPRRMPKTIGQWCEPLLYAARSAWRHKTGEEAEFKTRRSFETGSHTALWPPHKARDWREEAKYEIEMMRREARQMRELAENYEREAEKLEKKLRGEQK